MHTLNRFALGSALAILPLALTVGCDKKAEQADTAKAEDLVRKVAEAEKAEGQAKQAAQAQGQALAQAGVQPAAPAAPGSPATQAVQLTDSQRALLEKRVKEEKDNGTAALLQEILDRDKQIKELEGRVARLKADLPKPQVASEKDNHFTMAVRFLKAKGLSEDKAKTLAAKANLMEELQPGWQVYHQYFNGTYLTTVTQGSASISPSEFVKGQRIALERERDDTRAIAHGLADEVDQLVAQRVKIEEEISALRTEKNTLQSQVGELQTLSGAQKAKLNSMHYLVGARKQLEQDGIIVVPVFTKDRMGPKATVAKFDKDLLLEGNANPEVVIKASDLGVKKISKVSVVPGSLEKDKHYSIAYAEDKSSATVKILDPERLKNDRVVFAVAD
jgi:hypothetical protein